MKRQYRCPHCDATLNPNVKVVLTAVNRGKRALMLLSPQPGNYDVLSVDDLDLREGDIVDYFCPICGASLTSNVNECLAEIDMVMEGGTRSRVDFSRKVGERATYVVTNESIQSYGEDVDRYPANFFGSGK